MFLLQKLRLMYACLSLNTVVSLLLIRGGKCSDDKIFFNSSLARLSDYVWHLEKYQHYSLQEEKYISFHAVIKREDRSCMNCILISQPMEDGKYNQ